MKGWTFSCDTSPLNNKKKEMIEISLKTKPLQVDIKNNEKPQGLNNSDILVDDNFQKNW